MGGDGGDEFVREDMGVVRGGLGNLFVLIEKCEFVGGREGMVKLGGRGEEGVGK